VRRAGQAVTAAVRAMHDGSVPGADPRAKVTAVKATSTGVVVFVLAPPGGLPCAVVKMPITVAAAAGLARETATLASLHGDVRLGEWRGLLPRPLATGTIDGHPYRVDSVLPGASISGPLTDPIARAALLGGAAQTVAALHQATARTVRADSEIREMWIDAHIAELERRMRQHRTHAPLLRRLHGELHDSLAGRTLSAGRIHGDYWLGNLLFAGAGSTSPAPTGIVDWETAAPLELPLHDQLHLVLYTRRLIAKRELGGIVRQLLGAGGWSADEQAVLDRNRTWGRDVSSLSDRHALLLYWLRQVATHARQQPQVPGYRYRLWERRNVLAVLNAL
jgi:aminoglycoside phosphotransferase (APT) family kinase protein